MVGNLWQYNKSNSIFTSIMLNDIYNKQILAFAADIPRLGRLDAPDGTAVAHSRLCGSKVTVDVKLENGVVTDFAHDVKACALGQASSSIMARHVIGTTADDLRALREQMHAMLKENGPAPDGRWADLQALTPVRDFKARHASTLLTFDAVVKALDMAEGKAQAQADEAQSA
jgi:NifU-like protein involved in Fe-S cluster formation